MNKLAFLQPEPIGGKIRLGPNLDGGYVVYGRLLQETDFLMTYGVGSQISFEEDFNRLTNKNVVMFDPTIFGKYLLNFRFLWDHLRRLRLWAALVYLTGVWKLWRKKKGLESRNIYFVNEGLAKAKRDKYDTLANHIQRFGLQDKRFMLKLDIESSEYEVFEDRSILKDLLMVNQIVIEFHDLKNRLLELRNIIEMLEESFVLVHIHANNCAETFRVYDLSNDCKNMVVPDVIELLFVKRDKIRSEDLLCGPISYPVPDLDYPNHPYRKDHVMDFV